MIINMSLNDRSVVASVCDSGDNMPFAETILRCTDVSEWQDVCYRAMSKLGKKTCLSNVMMIRLSATSQVEYLEKAHKFDVLDADLARNLDMPCIPVLIEIE